MNDHQPDHGEAARTWATRYLSVRRCRPLSGEAATLNNIGLVWERLGDRRRALIYFDKALSLRREVGDRAGEAVTRYNLAMIHRADGDLDRAILQLEHVVELDRQVEHPDLDDDIAVLEQLRRLRAETST